MSVHDRVHSELGKLQVFHAPWNGPSSLRFVSGFCSALSCVRYDYRTVYEPLRTEL